MRRLRSGKSPARGVRHSARHRPLSPLAFLVGRVTLSGDAAHAAELLNLCMRYGLSYDSFTVGEDGRLRVTATYASAAKLEAICRARGLPLTVERRRGIGALFAFCLRRPGIPIGLSLALLLTVFSSTHLWEIRVTGNDVLSKTEVVSQLEAAGLKLGDVVSEIDVDSIENRLLMHSERISWITINLIGNVAEVQIREKTAPVEEKDTSPANLVARCDGVIVSCEVQNGNLLTKTGAAVRAGEVLVSGLYDSVTQGLRYTRAAGEIYAETEHVFTIEVPYAYEKTVYTGVEGTRRTLSFFGRSFVLSESDGFGGSYTVERLHELSVFGKALPIALSVETSYASRTVTGTYSPERATVLAYHRLSEALAALPGMRGILEKTISYEITEDAYILKCTVRCIENIAETKNIEVNLFD